MDKEENAKNTDWITPMELPAVHPEDYDTAIESGRGSASSRGIRVTADNDNDPARRKQKEDRQNPLHDEEIGGA